MEKREKIIVIMAVVAAIYGAIDVTMTTKKKQMQPIAPESSTQAVTVTPATLESMLSSDNLKFAAIAVSINESWPDHVFATQPVDFDGEKKIDETREALLNELRSKVSQLYYSGFVSMGDNRIAIINNMDYRIGEQIEGFTITKITLDAVQVSASNVTFDIPAATELPPPVPGHTPSSTE